MTPTTCAADEPLVQFKFEQVKFLESCRQVLDCSSEPIPLNATEVTHRFDDSSYNDAACCNNLEKLVQNEILSLQNPLSAQSHPNNVVSSRSYLAKISFSKE